MPKVRVEHAKPADLDAIAAMHLTTWRKANADLLPPSVLKKRGLPAFVREWKKMLQTDACETLVARLRDTIVGACSIGACGDPDLKDAPGSREVYSIFVDPQHQRTGIGRGLIGAHLRRAEYSALYAWVVVGNRPSEHFFAALDFAKEPDTEKDFPFSGIVLRVVRFRLDAGTKNS
jgi:GNAT superfamily N-acetyltransferase